MRCVATLLRALVGHPRRDPTSSQHLVQRESEASQCDGPGLVLADPGALAPPSPAFGGGRKFFGRLKKLKTTNHLVDSATIELVAKAHVRLDFHSLLPGYVVVDTARESDARRARELCAGLKAGEIVVLDRAHLDRKHLADRSEREVVWVTRWKKGIAAKKCCRYRV